MADEKRTEIASLGEFGLIDRISKYANTNNDSTIYGIGDDAAVIEKNEKEYTVISTDMLVEGIHFDLSFNPLRHLGYKAVAVNVSDIAAMNAMPEQITVSIAISNRFSIEAIEEFYKGVELACEKYKVDLVGGDTTSSLSGLVISVTAVGSVLKEKIAYRHTARVGDAICVTGDMGGAYLGLQILQREKEVFLSDKTMKPELDEHNYIIGRQLKPEARMDIIHELGDKKITPTAMIDVSDGLASELLHIATRSKVGVSVFDEMIPRGEEVKKVAFDFGIDPTTCVMNGGEDYELLFTVPVSIVEEVRKIYDVSVIGEVVDQSKGMNLITKAGNKYSIEAQGWNHFKD